MATIKPVEGFNEQPPPYTAGGQGAGPYPPGPGWNPPPQPHNQPMYPAPAPAPVQGTTIIVQPVPIQTGIQGCPACHAGVLHDTFGFCAILLAILFFPLGILCCLAMKEKRCTNCGNTF